VAPTSEAALSDARLARPTLLVTDARGFISNPELREEIFGPVSILVAARDVAEFDDVAAALEGQLTATVHAAAGDLSRHGALLRLLERRVGRLIFNGYPTGVEVVHAMQHGGPYPASTDARTTSVGTAALARFARPVSYQNFPDEALPAALRNANPLGIWRMVDGAMTRSSA
jgi:NADP-dependent aldehyde dehydrogenase